MASYLLDMVDTLLKGPVHFAHFGNEYLVRTPVFVLLCIAAILVRDRSYEIPGGVRITVGTREQTRRMLAELEKIW